MSNKNFNYAMYTFQTGHRPLQAFTEIIERLIDSLFSNSDEIEKEFGTTRRDGLEIALSDTAILMTYSLVEGFFYEEYEFYLGKKPKNQPPLEENIKEILLHLGNTENMYIIQGISVLPALRAARNAIAHRNGQLRDSEKKQLQMHFGEMVSISKGYPLASTECIIELLRKMQKLVNHYSEFAFKLASKNFT